MNKNTNRLHNYCNITDTPPPSPLFILSTDVEVKATSETSATQLQQYPHHRHRRHHRYRHHRDQRRHNHHHHPQRTDKRHRVLASSRLVPTQRPPHNFSPTRIETIRSGTNEPLDSRTQWENTHHQHTQHTNRTSSVFDPVSPSDPILLSPCRVYLSVASHLNPTRRGRT